MPRFSEQEKEQIQAALRREGHRLFAAHGLKKVTVEDLTQAAGISKGSFYAFYPTKEHLYAELHFRLQAELNRTVMANLEQHRNLPPQQLARLVFFDFFKGALEYELLRNTDLAVMQHLQRKLPPEIFAAHSLDDAQFVQALAVHGICFAGDIMVITKALQAVYAAAITLLGDEQLDDIIRILLEGIVEQVV